MFGYVMINPDTLTDAEKQRFREVYCGVCASLRERGGRRGQITLSYDAAFLALVLNALYEPEEQKGSTLCATHPTRRQHFSKSPMTLYAADVNLLLFYERMLDNWKDDRSHVSLALARFYRRRYQEAAARHPAQAQAIRKELQALSEVEKARLTDLDAAAGCFGRLLGAAFAPYDDEWKPGLTRMGGALGRFIYLIDAWDDAAKDERHGSYNPLLPLRREPDYEERVYQILTMEIAECAMEFEKLPIVQDAGIIRNVLYSGVWTVYSRRREAAEKKRKAASDGASPTDAQ